MMLIILFVVRVRIAKIIYYIAFQRDGWQTDFFDRSDWPMIVADAQRFTVFVIKSILMEYVMLVHKSFALSL